MYWNQHLFAEKVIYKIIAITIISINECHFDERFVIYANMQINKLVNIAF